MKLSEISQEKQPNTRFIVENYLIPANERNASIDVMLLALYMQVSRFLCWNRVKVMGIKGFEYPMLYAFNFAKSGTYKDEVVNSIINIIGYPLQEQAKVKAATYKNMKNKYEEDLKSLNGEDKKDFLINKKPKQFHNTFSEGTIQSLQKYRKAAEYAKLGYIHYEHDEFVDSFGKIDSNVKQILSMAKTAYQKGNSKANNVISEWRENVEDVPFTFFLHSSADELMKNNVMFKNLLSILGTGIGKRAFILFDDKTVKVKRTDKEVEYDAELANNSISHAEQIMTNAYLAIKMRGGLIEIQSCNDVEKRRNSYKNECIDFAEGLTNELVRLEIYDRSWRAFRLATSIAILEHPENLKVLPPDYEWAIYLTEKWGNQFKEFVLGESNLSIEQIYSFLLTNPHTSKTIIRRKVVARNTADLNYKINQVRLMADENEKLFITEKGRGLAEYYSIIDLTENYDTIDSIYSKNKDPKVLEALINQFGNDEIKIYLSSL